MRVAIADDHPLFRSGLGLLLTTAGVELTAAVGNAVDLLSAVAADPPDAVIVDAAMPYGHEGLEAAREIRSRHPDIAILVLSAFVETAQAGELLAAGSRGVGYLLKQRVDDVGELLDTLHRLRAGEAVLDPEIVQALLSRVDHASRETSAVDQLTPRERDVLRLMAEGRTNRTIAEALYLSVPTIEEHVGRIFNRLGLSETDATQNRRVRAVVLWERTRAHPR